MKINEVRVYFQGTCFPQKFVGVQIGFGLSATLEPGDRRADAETRLYAACKRRVEDEIETIMRGARAVTAVED